jgi:hypothetical protein
MVRPQADRRTANKVCRQEFRMTLRVLDVTVPRSDGSAKRRDERPPSTARRDATRRCSGSRLCTSLPRVKTQPIEHRFGGYGISRLKEFFARCKPSAHPAEKTWHDLLARLGSLVCRTWSAGLCYKSFAKTVSGKSRGAKSVAPTPSPLALWSRGHSLPAQQLSGTLSLSQRESGLKQIKQDVAN